MTAMSEPAYAGEAPFVNLATVKAIIRKDMRTLAPMAAGVAAISFLMSAFFHNESDFPDFELKFGGDFDMHTAPILSFTALVLLLFGTALFIVLLVQQDRATDPRNDWMARPIKAGELVLAKSLTVAAVVLAPTGLGAIVSVLLGSQNADAAFMEFYFAVVECSLYLTLGWLCSGTIQALLATVGLVILTFAMISFSAGVTEVRQSLEAASPAPADGLVSAAPTPIEPTRAAPASRTATSSRDAVTVRWDALPLAAGLLTLMFAGVGVTLWLLLGRRQVTTARLTFVVLYATSIVALTQSVARVDVSASVPAATLEQRMAAFRRHDADGDLKLDKAEYAKVLADLGFAGQIDTFWPQRDVNGDGFIDAAEMQRDLGLLSPAATLQQRMTAFTQSDLNKDGKLTKDEYALALKLLGYSNQLEDYWAQRDTDKDGFISLEEYLPAIVGPAPPTRPF